MTAFRDYSAGLLEFPSRTINVNHASVLHDPGRFGLWPKEVEIDYLQL